MSTFAIIRTGGKQYKVSKGDKIKIEKLEVKVGDIIIFDDVLLVKDKDKTKIGAPKVRNAKVEAKALEQGKGKKVIIFKYKAKKRYKKKQGHRQYYTEIEIIKIIY